MAEAHNFDQDQVVPSLESGVDEVESEPHSDIDDVEVYKQFSWIIL